MKARKAKHGWLLTLIFSVISVLYMYPIILVFINSFKKKAYISRYPFKIPKGNMFVGWENYIRGLEKTGFFEAFLWTLFITVCSVALIVVCCSMCAWYISRVKTLSTKIIYVLCLFAMVVPFQMEMYTLSKIANMLKLDNPWGLIIIYLGFGAGLAVFMFTGFVKAIPIEIEEASAGDIVAIAGLADIGVGETVCTTGKEEALPLLKVDEPTIQMVFGTNTSPFAGQDGKFVTARQIEERLFKETNRDVSLKIERIPNSEEWIVSGRGELHLSILIENMRREGYELQVSKPKVIIKEIDGVLCEPYEEVNIEAPDDCIGNVIESLGYRRGVLENMVSNEGQTSVTYTIPSRGMIGFMTNFLTMTKGYGIISHSFLEYRPMEGESVGERSLGVLVSIDNGQTTAYALGGVEDRGVMFIGPGVDVYEGMIVGEHSRDNDLVVNVTKGKQLTNTRSSSKDSTVVLKRPRTFNLEACLDYINDDELVEVTPENIRLRKRYLTEQARKQQNRLKQNNS